MNETKVSVSLIPEDAVKLLKAYDNSEFAWHLVSTLTTVSNVVTLQIQQDGQEEPVLIKLLPDGTWELRTMVAVLGDTQ